MISTNSCVRMMTWHQGDQKQETSYKEEVKAGQKKGTDRDVIRNWLLLGGRSEEERRTKHNTKSVSQR